MKLKTIAFSLMLMILATCLACQLNAQDDPHPGISDTKPAEGHFVELPNGKFMVPFTVTIPGTDVHFDMVPIPGGTFVMGSPESEEERTSAEGPQVNMVIEPFWMGKHEVTWAEYKSYMRLDTIFKSFNSQGIRQITKETEIDAVTAPSGLYDPSFTYDAGDDPNTPAATMTQFAAKQYTKWLSGISGHFFRLPSEGEWEYACRAGTTTAYYFGDDPEAFAEYGWFEDNSDWERQEVGQLKPNAWGLYDMHGNVAEWVLDEYSDEGLTVDTSGTEKRTPAEPLVAWPTEIWPRTVKGGTFELSVGECRSASRMGSDDDEWKIDDPNTPQSPWWYTTEPATGVGFRIICPLHVPESAELKAKFWEADHPWTIKTIENRIETNGKGAWGIADPSLPEAIENNRKSK